MFFNGEEEFDAEKIMADAQEHGMKSAKSVGVMASKAWTALEEERYADAAALYSLISKSTSSLATQTFAMAQQVELNELDDSA